MSRIARLFAALGVRVVFAVPGVPVTRALNAVRRHGHTAVVVNRHENHAVNAAAAYGYKSGATHRTPGVVVTTSGPACLNALSQLVNAAGNQHPLVLISSSQAWERPHLFRVQFPRRFQELPQKELAQAFVTNGLLKEAFYAESVAQLAEHLSRAFQIALSPCPGPVYVQVNWPVWSSMLEDAPLPSIVPVPSAEHPLLPIDALAGTLTDPWRKSHVLFVVGEHLAYAGVEPDTDFAGLDFPCIATPMGRGSAPERLEVYACRSKALKEARLVVFLGAMFDWRFNATDDEFWSGKQVVLVHEQSGSLPKFKPFVIPFNCCPRRFLQGLRQLQVDLSGSRAWLAELRASHLQRLSNTDCAPSAPTPLADRRLHVRDGGLSLRALYLSVSNAMTPATYFVAEGATSMDAARRYVKMTRPGMCLDAGAYGSMGIGLPYAIGLAAYIRKYGPEDGRVIVSVGDSAWGFAGTEMETVARYKLPICVLIVDNGGMYAVDGDEPSLPQRDDLDVDVTDLSEVCFENMVAHPGVVTGRVNSRTFDTFAATQLPSFIASGTPCVFHVIVDPCDGSNKGFIAKH